MEYDLGDYVFLNVSLMHKVAYFGMKGKLALKNVGLFEIIERVGGVAYCLNLPP